MFLCAVIGNRKLFTAEHIWLLCDSALESRAPESSILPRLPRLRGNRGELLIDPFAGASTLQNTASAAISFSY